MADFRDLDCLLEGFTKEKLPACAMQIAQRSKTIYEGYFGYSDLDAKTPVTKDSVFRQASLSKLPLYTTMMMLYEKGKFLLSDPISNYFPEWATSKKVIDKPDGSYDIVPTNRPIIISDVLSMKCGLPYCNFPGPTTDPTMKAMQEGMKPLWEKGHYTIREQVRAMAEAPLAFEPGTDWLYGFASELAAGIIEEVCGKSIDDVFLEFLFEPLGMENTRSHYFGDIKERMVKLYGLTPEGELKPTTFKLDDRHQPGIENERGWARLFSTVNDYTKLMQMLANGGVYEGRRIMGRKTIDLMRSNSLSKPFDDTYNAGYGYGFGVRTLVDKNKGNHNGSLGAFGWTGGFGSWCEADPEEGVSIVYMHNRIPNGELYYHLRMRAAAYGCLS